MGTFNVKSIREQLASALSREFDCTRKVSIYGAGSASAFAGPCFEETGEIACFIDETLTLGGGGGGGGRQFFRVKRKKRFRRPKIKAGPK